MVNQILADEGELVTALQHWSERVFSFRLSRPASLRFRSGEFVMIGLKSEITGKPILRAYSICSPSWADELEFYSIKAPKGELTSRLQSIEIGQRVILRPKATGTLVLDALLPGERLWLFATGTGFAPFASLVRDTDTYDRFKQVIVVHGCRHPIDLSYSRHIIDHTIADELVGDYAKDKLTYWPMTSEGKPQGEGRITTALQNGSLVRHLDLPPLDPLIDRVMLCGSMNFNLDMKAILTGYGYQEGSLATPGEFVYEKAFVG